ncbi:HPt (histidine-containing phosphotransfer) domain-containing protein [Litorivivens lipolytica]|uniref:HPt (Histidine-containing phosphotransfer) domain-containing protein n=1 Tax=Litorivivens lipolytica TaxID=1524264 RepID=A0A7W4W469_9GAMM|nr:Hpt domain-containing protein [Litorivivens lipolytica]MBB3047155.1 HPt (histidine-containing phosphotransfer) domain-containing protein [Litorivivens lipolytica]
MDFDPSVLNEILPDCPDLQAETLQDYLQVLDCGLTELDRGLSDIALADVVRSSHRLKGASQSVGAMAVAALCQEIEAAGRANDSSRFADFRTQLPACAQALQKIIRENLSA